MSDLFSIQPGHKVTLPRTGTLPSAVHVFDADSIFAVNAALAAGRPLLVRGEPGTGKTQLARAVAVELGRAFIAKTVDAQTEARDLLWEFDAVARLAEAQVLGTMRDTPADSTRAALQEKRFVRPGPLWWAFDWQTAVDHIESSRIHAQAPSTPKGWKPKTGCVVLVDEIDKADSSVPNGLLEALGIGRFDVIGLPDGVALSPTTPAPLVVVTTNEERALPDPFLRRCLVLQLRLPEGREALEAWLVERGRAHFAKVGGAVLEAAARQLAEDRDAVVRRGLSPPGQAEYLDLIRALDTLRPGDEAAQLELLETIARFALEKHPRDSDMGEELSE